jgi:hypothetical protein
MTKSHVTLVRNLSVLYPHTDKDYEHLEQLGTPIRHIDVAYMPTLRAFARSTTTFNIILLSDLEEKMMVKFNSYWPHGSELSDKSITLTCPRMTADALIDKAVSALKKWYRNHFIQLEQVTKRGGKTTRIVLVKKPIE